MRLSMTSRSDSISSSTINEGEYHSFVSFYVGVLRGRVVVLVLSVLSGRTSEAILL